MPAYNHGRFAAVHRQQDIRKIGDMRFHMWARLRLHLP
jgi:hypothetical protein